MTDVVREVKFNRGAEVQQNVVEMLERYLQRAKAGEIKALAIAAVTQGDMTVNAYEQGEFSKITLHSAVTSLAFRVSMDLENAAVPS